MNSVFSALKEYLSHIYQTAHSVARALAASVPYLFNLNPNNLRKEVTEQYPDPVSSKTVDDLPPRTRGLLHNAIEQCIGCHECEKICPVQCIQMKTERPEANQKEWVSVYNIDHSKCVFCGLCVEICPPGSLKHTKRYEFAEFSRAKMVEEFGKGDAPKRGEFS